MLTLLPYPFKSLFNAEQYKARQDKSANYNNFSGHCDVFCGL